MSRFYRLDVEAVGISEKDLRKVLVDEYGWEETGFHELQGRISFSGIGYISGGQNEEELHDEIYSKFKSLNPDCKARTRWTYLEHLPFDEYGDELD